MNELIDRLFAHGVNPPTGHGVSLALVVQHQGEVVAERYGVQPASVFGPEVAITADSTLVSWSMAKSMVHALVGQLVSEGHLDVDAPAPVDEWKSDERASITLGDLLRMRDGLDYVEDYAPAADDSTAGGAARSDVIEMLFGSGANDVAAYARSRPFKYARGSVWSYSSGTTNIISSIVGDVVVRLHGGVRDAAERADVIKAYVSKRLFAPLGMTSATARTDEAGNFIGSSYAYATARDFAKFGQLYLQGGEFDGVQVVPREWVASAFDRHVNDPENGHGYSWHWWPWLDAADTTSALGYEGQRIIVDASRDLVIVHLGKWTSDTQRLLDGVLDNIRTSFPKC